MHMISCRWSQLHGRKHTNTCTVVALCHIPSPWKVSGRAAHSRILVLDSLTACYRSLLSIDVQRLYCLSAGCGLGSTSIWGTCPWPFRYRLHHNWARAACEVKGHDGQGHMKLPHQLSQFSQSSNLHSLLEPAPLPPLSYISLHKMK
jgi:hypothetical protein